MPDGTVELTLAHSPDADDMVMWWPLTGMRGPDGKPVDGPLGRPAIDTGRFGFRCIPEDVQVLNRAAIEAAERQNESRTERDATGWKPAPPAYDITAISCAAYPLVRSLYAVTSCGGSFGEGYGPKLVVPAEGGARSVEELAGARVAVPGMNTTAFMVLGLMLGGRFEALEVPFARIAPMVAGKERRHEDTEAQGVDAGLLIHEVQISFEDLGLRALADLGVWWREQTGMPLPLGLNVVRRDLDARFGEGTVAGVSRLLAASVRHAAGRREDSRRFLLLHADGRPEWRDAGLVDRYLEMYVSGLTVDMGERGRGAVRELLGRGHAAGLCPDPGEVDVV